MKDDTYKEEGWERVSEISLMRLMWQESPSRITNVIDRQLKQICDCRGVHGCIKTQSLSKVGIIMERAKHTAKPWIETLL